MNWSDQAWKTIEPVYNRILQLPFIGELMAGTLPEEKFLFYLQQDACYLAEYGKILAGIAAKADSTGYKQAFLKFAGDTVSVEQALHEFYLCNISDEDRAEPSTFQMKIAQTLPPPACFTPGICIALFRTGPLR